MSSATKALNDDARAPRRASASTIGRSWSRPAPARARPPSWPDASRSCSPRASRPSAIAAVTFTELAAERASLARPRICRRPLGRAHSARAARGAARWPLGSAARNLAPASAAIDEITCSTIHGFCQRLIKPYPAEADIDPGASVMDRNQADLAFLEIVDDLAARAPFRRAEGGILAEMVLHDPGETVALDPQDRRESCAAGARCRRRPVSPLAPSPRGLPAGDGGFRGLHAHGAGREDGDGSDRRPAGRDGDRAGGPRRSRDAGRAWSGFWSRVRIRDLCTKAGTFLAYQEEGQMDRRGKARGPLQGRWRAAQHRSRRPLHRLLRGVDIACFRTCASRVLAELIAEVRPDLRALPRPQARGGPARFRRPDLRRARPAARP